MRLLALLFPLAWAAPAFSDDSGEAVYRHTCAACHSTKFDKAPQLGDRTAWAPLIKEGQDILTAHAFVGVRNMPPRGGNADLGLKEFARAVAYMARQAGGDWQEPDDALLAKIRTEVENRQDSKH